MTKQEQPKKSKLDGMVYALVLIALSVLAAAGVMYYLQPVDAIIRGAAAFMLVGSLFYIAIRNR